MSFFVSGYVAATTHDAVLLAPESSIFCRRGDWYPRSQIISHTGELVRRSGEKVTLEITDWMAKKRGLC